MSKTAQEMQTKAMEMAVDFAKSGYTPSEGAAVMAMSVAIVFKTEGVSQHEAVNRFATVVRNVYKGETK